MKGQADEDVWNDDDVVLVHDWIGGVFGAEQTLRELAAIFPRAPILTLFADRLVVRRLGIDESRVRQSYLGRVPNAVRYRKYLLPWMADAIQTLDVGDARLIVSSTHAVAKSVPHRSYQTHLAYVYSPMRYAHDLMFEHVASTPWPLRPLVRSVLRKLAVWDVATAQRVRQYVGISRAVALRIWRTYRRRALVIHPPVDVEAVPVGRSAPADHYLVLSRLAPYKRIDLAIRAVAAMKRHLVIAGDGPERRALERLAVENGVAKLIDFVGHVSEQEKWRLLGNARALLFPGEEDFGIVGVEALAAGTPVVALGRGGMLDIVGSREDGFLVTGPARSGPGGVLFAEQTATGLVSGMQKLEESGVPDREVLRQVSERFSVGRFRTQMLSLARRLVGGRTTG